MSTNLAHLFDAVNLHIPCESVQQYILREAQRLLQQLRLSFQSMDRSPRHDTEHPKPLTKKPPLVLTEVITRRLSLPKTAAPNDSVSFPKPSVLTEMQNCVDVQNMPMPQTTPAGRKSVIDDPFERRQLTARL